MIEKVKEYQAQILSNKIQIGVLNRSNSDLKKTIRDDVFNLVFGYVTLGDTLEFTKTRSKYNGEYYDVQRGGMKSGDKVRIIKKNEKSVVIEFIKVNNIYRRAEKVGKTKRVKSETFGDFVYNNSTLGPIIERDIKLKAILEECC